MTQHPIQPQVQPQIHLNEDQLDELLLGCASPESFAHIEHCAVCAGQLAEFRSAISNFNHAASAWSEARSNALTRDLNQHRTPFRITARAAWSCASAVVLAAAALGLGLHERSAQIAESQMIGSGEIHQASPESASQREFASDDAMLRQIDSEINTAEPSPEELYGVADVSRASRSNSGGAQVKD